MPRTPKQVAAESVLHDLPFSLARAALVFRRFSELTLREVGLEALAPGLASVLHTLMEIETCTVARLVERTQLPNGTLTGLLDELERQGALMRTRNPRDGRSWLIELTGEGQRLGAQLKKRHQKVDHFFRACLSDGEQSELARLLGKVTICMQHYDVQHSPKLAKPSLSGQPARSKARISSPHRKKPNASRVP